VATRFRDRPMPGRPWQAWPGTPPDCGSGRSYFRHLPTSRPAGDRCGPSGRMSGAGSNSDSARDGSTKSTAPTHSLSARGERFDRLEEQLAVITGMWSTPAGEMFDYDGATTSSRPAPLCRSRSRNPPADHRRRFGTGPHARLAARFATEFNTPFLNPDDAAAQFERSARPAKPPVAIRAAWATRPRWLCVAGGRGGGGQAARAIGREVDDLRANGVCGTPAEVVDRLVHGRELGGHGVPADPGPLRPGPSPSHRP